MKGSLGKFNILINLFLVVNIVMLTNCSNSKLSDNWDPKTLLLDKLRQSNPDMIGFVDDVESFYQNLHDKNWSNVYKGRYKLFREDMSEQMFVDLAKKTGNDWSLINYDVLSIKIINTNKAELICKFIEGPSLETNYNSVIWVNEGGRWRCEDAGPIELIIFQNTRSQGN